MRQLFFPSNIEKGVLFLQKSGQVFDDLAEQYLVDCAYDYSTEDGFDAQGCAGAWPQAYLEYLEKARL